jgi:hypothetical protein
MTRALLEQALAALTYKGTSAWAKKRPVIEAIRAHLAQPQPEAGRKPKFTLEFPDLSTQEQPKDKI